jgi:hypothetical protein
MPNIKDTFYRVGEKTTVTEQVKQSIRDCYYSSTGHELGLDFNPFDYVD